MDSPAATAPLAPDQISHEYVVFITIAVCMTLLSTVFVILRFVARRLSMLSGWDDWVVLGALVFAYGFLITTVLVATVAHAGYHITQYNMQQLESYFKIGLANNLCYNASITLSKASLLLLYRRIFAVRSFIIWTWIVGMLLLGYFLAAEGGLLFATNPVQAQWKFWLPHTTIDDKKFWLTMAIFNILLDVIILCMPQARVWRLHQTLKKKFLLSIVFLLGGFVCVASIVRIASLETVNIADLTYTLTVPGIWTLVEMNASIICACLPTLPTLFHYRHNRTKPKGSQATTESVGAKLLVWLRLTRTERSTKYADLEDGCKSSASSSIRKLHDNAYGEGITNDGKAHQMSTLDHASHVHVRTDINITDSIQ